MRYIHFIVNPISGKGNHKIDVSFLKSFFKEDEYKIEVEYSNYKKHAKELATKAVLLQPDTIVACGGDGTINEVASALVNTTIALGIVPVGSGNGLASNLKIPRNIEASLEIIKKNTVSSIDVGQVNQTYFFSNMGLGIDSQIIKNYESYSKRTLYAYVKASLSASLNYNPPKATVIFNDNKIVLDPFLLFISNSNEMGYNMSLTPKASLSDGLLNVIAVPEINFFEKLYFGTLVMLKNTEAFKKAEVHLANKINISLEKALQSELQIDGEFHVFTGNTIEVKLLPNALQVIC